MSGQSEIPAAVSCRQVTATFEQQSSVDVRSKRASCSRLLTSGHSKLREAVSWPQVTASFEQPSVDIRSQQASNSRHVAASFEQLSVDVRSQQASNNRQLTSGHSRLTWGHSDRFHVEFPVWNLRPFQGLFADISIKFENFLNTSNDNCVAHKGTFLS